MPRRPSNGVAETVSAYTLAEAQALLDAYQTAALEHANRGGMIRARSGGREFQFENSAALLNAIDDLTGLVNRLTANTSGFVGVSFRKPT
jgi:hypothetical protein